MERPGGPVIGSGPFASRRGPPPVTAAGLCSPRTHDHSLAQGKRKRMESAIDCRERSRHRRPPSLQPAAGSSQADGPPATASKSPAWAAHAGGRPGQARARRTRPPPRSAQGGRLHPPEAPHVRASTRATAVMHYRENDDALVGHPVDGRERERGEDFGANRDEGDRRRLRKGLNLLEGALRGVKKRAAQPGSSAS